MIFGRTSIVAAAVASLASLGAASNAHAGFDFRINVGPTPPQRVWVEPVYQTTCDRVWVEPVYQTQCAPVYHEAVYQDQPVQVWVPDRFETRHERYRDECGRLVTREVRYVACAGHYETQLQKVLVRGPYTEQIDQPVLVTAGYWSNVERRVCATPGHWEETCVPDRPAVRIDVDGHRDDHPRDWDRGDRHDPRGYDDHHPDDRGGYYGRR